MARLYSDEDAAALRSAEAQLEASKVRATRAETAIRSARAELEQAEKNVLATRETVAEAEANHNLATIEYRRAQDLLAKGDGSQASYDTAKAALDANAAQVRAAAARERAAEAAASLSQSRVEFAEADHAAAVAEVNVLAASVDLATATLEKTEVKAPFDGIVVLKDAEVGEVVSPNSQGGSNARGSICTLVDPKSFEAQAEVPEASIAGVVVGESASIFLDAYPDIRYLGQVDRIWPTADRQKATVEVRIKFIEPDDLLRPEMGLRVVFAAAETEASSGGEPAILIPLDAVVEHQGGRGVFVLERDVVHITEVDLGEQRSGRVVVRAGLQPGQRIVLAPPVDLQSGDRVRIQSN